MPAKEIPIKGYEVDDSNNIIYKDANVERMPSR